MSLYSVDRYVLETVIFPHLNERDDYQRILFVGCDWYTKWYNSLFKTKDYWTIEINPNYRRFGAKQHIVDSIENLDQHFQPNQLDVIVCNGVFGFGLNEKTAVEQAFTACYDCLRPGGLFVLGWNDVEEFRPFPLTEIESLNAFVPQHFPPLATAVHRTATPLKHTLNFYTKSPDESGA